MPIDGLIDFTESDTCVQVSGADKIKGVMAHAMELKVAGAKCCGCSTCAVTEAILEEKDDVLR